MILNYLRRGRIALVLALSAETLAAVAVTAPSRLAYADDAVDAGAKEWSETVRLFQTLLTEVNNADRALTAFTTKNKLTAKGKARAKTVAGQLDAARQQLQTTLDAASLLSKRPKTTADDAVRFRASNAQVLADGADAVQKEQASEQDATLVDRSEEEAAARRAAFDKARADQESARREAEERRKADEDKRRAEAEERRKGEEARRKTEGDARRSAEEQRKAAAEAATSMAAAAAVVADSKARGEVDAKRTALETSVREQSERARDAALGLAGFLAKANVTIDARGAATRYQRALETAAAQAKAFEKKIADTAALSTRPAGAALATLAPEVERSARDIRTTAEAARVLVANTGSYLTGKAPAPTAPTVATTNGAPEPRPQAYRTEDFIPMCDFSFEPAAPDAKSVTLSIDGGPYKPLPTRTRLASGRHSLSVKRDRALQERRELLLCGHIAVIPIEAPK
jgi:hypothetical protein